MSQSAIRNLVLVVEQEEAARRQAQHSLESLGWNVQAVDSAAHAIAFLQHTKPDAMLIDAQLPDVPGDEFAGALRSHFATRSIRLVGCAAPGQAGGVRPQAFDALLSLGAMQAELARALPLPTRH